MQSIKDLSAMDLLNTKIKLKVENKIATLVDDKAELSALLSLARFSLKGLPENAVGDLSITDKNDQGGIIRRKDLDLFTAQNAGQGKGDITIKDVNSNEDVYVAFYPGTYTLSFSFKARNNVTYKYAFDGSTELVKGTYYRSFLKDEGATEGKISGIPVNLTIDEDADLVYGYLHLVANFEGHEKEEIIIRKPFDADGTCTFYLYPSRYAVEEGNCEEYKLNGRIVSCAGNKGKKLPLNPGYKCTGWKSSTGEFCGDGATIRLDNIDTPNTSYFAFREKE